MAHRMLELGFSVLVNTADEDNVNRAWSQDLSNLIAANADANGPP
jgi:hypothetical protein